MPFGLGSERVDNPPRKEAAAGHHGDDHPGRKGEVGRVEIDVFTRRLRRCVASDRHECYVLDELAQNLKDDRAGAGDQADQRRQDEPFAS